MDLKERKKEPKIDLDKEVIFFVYGSLKEGSYNNYLLRGSEKLGDFTTPANYTLFDGGYPVVERGGTTSIVGELYKTTDQNIITSIFSLEGCSRIQDDPKSWYTYDVISINEKENAIIFVMNEGCSGRSERAILTNGIWK